MCGETQKVECTIEKHLLLRCLSFPVPVSREALHRQTKAWKRLANRPKPLTVLVSLVALAVARASPWRSAHYGPSCVGIGEESPPKRTPVGPWLLRLGEGGGMVPLVGDKACSDSSVVEGTFCSLAWPFFLLGVVSPFPKKGSRVRGIPTIFMCDEICTIYWSTPATYYN